MTLLFRRQVLLEIAGFEIEDLKIQFSVERETEKPPRAKIDIFNLSDDSETRIKERGKTVRLDAGYPDTIATIFEGAVDRVNATRQPPARITKIECGGKADAGTDIMELPNANGVIKVRTYPQGTPIRTIAMDLIAEMGLEADESIELIPAGASVSRPGGWVYALTPASGLNLCLQLEGLSLGWTEENGICVIIPRRTLGEQAEEKGANPNAGLPAGADEITVSAATGLIGSPAQTEDNKAECTLFLNPLLRIGAKIVLESETVQGNWRVSGLRHRGDNWQGQFVSECDLRSLA